jgi:serine/threonine protein kinase
MLKGVGHDRACDLWSLGILIYEMLHGITPFGADEDSAIFHGILNVLLPPSPSCPGFSCGKGVDVAFPTLRPQVEHGAHFLILYYPPTL